MNPFLADFTTEPEAFLEVRGTGAGALIDGLIDLGLDLAWDIDGGGESSSDEITMKSTSERAWDLDVEDRREV